MAFLSLLVALSAVPGQAVSVSVPARPAVTAVQIEFELQQQTLAPTADGWVALLGVDLDVQPGKHPVTLTFAGSDGSVYSESLTLEVLPKDYPTTKLEVEPKYVELSSENQQRSASESVQIKQAYAITNPKPYWSADYIIPVEGATEGSNFGHRRIFNNQPRAPHSGADLKAATGTPILAANAGKVLLIGVFFFNGKSVFVDHGMGVLTMYLHLSEISVTEGQLLERGEIVGLAGATGRVTGPHLHWGARVGGARVDPFSLPGIAGKDTAAASADRE